MEKIVLLDDIKKLDFYSKFDGYLLTSSFSSFFKRKMDENEIIESIIKIKRQEKNIYLLVDKILLNEDLNKLSLFIDIGEKYNLDGYFFSDLGVITLLKNKNIISKGIYFSQTQIVSSLEFEAYSDIGLKCIFCSSQYLPLDLKNKKCQCGVLVYGYKNLFYSKRKLISCYEEFYNEKVKGHDLKIRETKRKMKNIIYEDDDGTYIFKDYISSLLDRNNAFLENNFDMVLFNDNFIDSSFFIKKMDDFFNNLYFLEEGEKDDYE